MSSAAGFPEPAGALPTLTGPQHAAVAKLAYAADQSASIAVLCGPAGVGKTTVLRHVAAIGMPTGRTILLGTQAELADPDQAIGSGDTWSAAADPPDLLLVDDADRAAAADLCDLIERWRRRRADIVFVLAGQGRLLSLMAADTRLERSVRLRVALPTFTLSESSRLVAAVWPLQRPAAEGEADGVIRTIHEIAGGVPAVALRLAEMAAMLAAADPGRGLVPEDIETIHRRLWLTAA
jgi:hypothetical protein